MLLKRQSDGQPVLLTPTTLVGGGGEGNIYRISDVLVAKIYHKPTFTHGNKLRAMLLNPPEAPQIENRTTIAWPVDLLLDPKDQVRGFLMPYVTEVRPIIDYYNPKTRNQSCPFFNYRYLHRTARNLAAAIQALHGRGYVIGDINESNILVTERAVVTLVDTDSFQVRNLEQGITYRCKVGKPEFTPPELQGTTFAQVDRTPEHDLFGLAVLLFQLLMEGTHPYAGVYQGSGDPPTLEERIRDGHYLHSGANVPYRPMPIAPALGMLNPRLRELFRRCFEEGYRTPGSRPDARTWQLALDDAETDLRPCTVNKHHLYGRHLTRCPWCERTALLGGRDPFLPQPSLPRIPTPVSRALVKHQRLPIKPRPATPIPKARTLSWLAFPWSDQGRQFILKAVLGLVGVIICFFLFYFLFRNFYSNSETNSEIGYVLVSERQIS